MKKVLLLLLTFYFLHLTTSLVHANLVTVKPDGELEWDVLASQSTGKGIENTLKKVEGMLDSIVLTRKDNTISMSITEDSMERQFSIKNTQGDIIEVEERPDFQKMKVSVREGKFILEQNGYLVQTDFPLSINPKSGKIMVLSESKEERLWVFPKEAVDTVLRSNLLSNVSQGAIQIVEEQSDFVYKLEGEKVFTILRFFEYKIPVSAFVTLDGNLKKIDSPTWYRFVDLIFV